MSKLSTVIGFTLGMLIGAAASYIYCEKVIMTKYQQISDDEISSMKNYYESKYNKTDDELVKAKNNYESEHNKNDSKEEKKRFKNYSDLAKDYNKTEKKHEAMTTEAPVFDSMKFSETNIVDEYDEDDEEDYILPPVEDVNPNPKEFPYLIDYNDFGEFESYNRIELTYFADDEMADDLDDLIADPITLLGKEIYGYLKSCNHNGETNKIICVRHDPLKCDYEITFDLRPYTDLLQFMPMDRREENDPRKRN